MRSTAKCSVSGINCKQHPFQATYVHVQEIPTFACKKCSKSRLSYWNTKPTHAYILAPKKGNALSTKKSESKHEDCVKPQTLKLWDGGSYLELQVNFNQPVDQNSPHPVIYVGLFFPTIKNER